MILGCLPTGSFREYGEDRRKVAVGGLLRFPFVRYSLGNESGQQG